MRKLHNYPAVLLLGLLSACSENTSVDAPSASTDVATKRPTSEEAGNRPASERADSATLFEAAAALYGKEKIENAGFLFYVAQLRARIDLKAYAPVGSGGNDPGLAIAAVSGQLGSRINPSAMRDRDIFGRIVERVSSWSPVFDPAYDPGWEHKTSPNKAEFDKQVAEVKAVWIGQMRDFSELLQDDEYYDLFQKVQKYNLAGIEDFSPETGGRDAAETMSEEDYAASVVRLEQIEAQHGSKFGPFTKRDPDMVREADYDITRSEVTYLNRKIADADPSTFLVLPEVEFAKDIAHVYVLGHVIPAADPQTFQVIKGPFSRDATTFFCGNIAMEVRNIDTFEVVDWKGMWRECLDRGMFLFDYGETFRNVEIDQHNPAVVGKAWARDGEFYYCGPARIEDADYETFQIYEGPPLQVDEYYSAQDKNRKYFMSFPIEQLPDRRRQYLGIE